MWLNLDGDGFVTSECEGVEVGIKRDIVPECSPLVTRALCMNIVMTVMGNQCSERRSCKRRQHKPELIELCCISPATFNSSGLPHESDDNVHMQVQ